MKLSLFSVSYAGYWGQHSLDLPAFIAKAGRLGYSSVMLAGKRPHLSPLDAVPSLVEAIQAALEKNNVQCDAIAGYVDLRPAMASEVPYLEMQISYLESLCALAARLGAGIVRAFTAYESEGMASHSLWVAVVKTLQEVCERASGHDVQVAIQNHHDLALHSDALLELLADVDRPNCKLGFDAWSVALRGEDLFETAKKMAPHTVMTTNADYVRFPRYRYQPDVVNYVQQEPDLVRAVPFGNGFINYPEFFRGLREGGFEGLANYEMCSPVRGGGSEENLDAYAGRYVQWMREHGFCS